MERYPRKRAAAITYYENGVAKRHELDKKGNLIDRSIVGRSSSKRSKKINQAERTGSVTETSTSSTVNAPIQLDPSLNLNDPTSISSELINLEWQFKVVENDEIFDEDDFNQLISGNFFQENLSNFEDELMDFAF